MMDYRYSTKSHNLKLSRKPRKRKLPPALRAAAGNRRKYCRDGEENDNFQLVTASNNDQEPEVSTPLSDFLKGRRIVDIAFFFHQMQAANDHGVFDCNFKDMEVIGETRKGLNSCIKLRCKMCRIEKLLWTEEPNAAERSVNTEAVAAVITTGNGFSCLEEFLGTMNIPCMSSSTFAKEQAKLASAWEATALEEMKAAAEEEKEIAIRNGEVDAEGTPLLTVVVDGSWAKRSYGCNYSSLSGVAAILGYKTKKVLHLGVRNKFCAVCAKYESAAAPEHICYKNWFGSSSAMEADILVEGFQSSLETYGVKYARFIGDGDSNVLKKLVDARPYVDVTIEKIECRNHLLRNFCNKLKDVVKNAKYGPVSVRKNVMGNILRFRKAVVGAANFRKGEQISEPQKIQRLRKDLLNVLYHVFGDHTNCCSYFCRPKDSEINYVPEMTRHSAFARVMEILGGLADNARSILFNATSNCVEQYNSIVAKFIGGKRINFCSRGSYQSWCFAAAVAHNSCSPRAKLHRRVYRSSPGFYLKRLERRRRETRLSLKKRRAAKRAAGIRPKRLFPTTPDPGSYGRSSEKPDLADEVMEVRKWEFLERLSLTEAERENLQRDTVIQGDSVLWKEERRKRLTASNFGRVCNKRPSTHCSGIIKTLLYTSFETVGIHYGRQSERTALECLQKKLGVKITACGLFIDKAIPFLGATPDGLIDEDGIVEVKCPWSCRNLTPEEGIREKHITFWACSKNGEIGGYKRKHAFHFQIQGQLHITQREYCIFVVWTPKGIKIERIERDDQFWKNEMEKKLKDFYLNCILPELVDPRYKRSMEIRNPTY